MKRRFMMVVLVAATMAGVAPMTAHAAVTIPPLCVKHPPVQVGYCP